MKHISIYVDGCALTNPGASGAGIVLTFGEHQKEMIVPLGHGTNNTAELLAVIHALESLTQPCKVDIYSDSQWAVKCGNHEWRRHTHPELWQRLYQASLKHEVLLHWIRKDTHELNKRAHMLANEAANEAALAEA